MHSFETAPAMPAMASSKTKDAHDGYSSVGKNKECSNHCSSFTGLQGSAPFLFHTMLIPFFTSLRCIFG